jgi:putative nucleotidyltransferase with HDIG domain
MNAARGQLVLLRATVGLGAGVFVVAVWQAVGVPLAVLAFGAAAVLLTELVQVSGDERSLDPIDSQPFSFASPTHIALVVVAGTWPAALLAGIGIVVVDRLRGSPPRAVAFNAAVFVLATAGGGAAFSLAGGSPGAMALPADFGPFVALALSYILLNLALVNAIAALSGGGSPLSELRDVLRTDPSSRAAEAGLALVIAFAVLYEPWALVACVPLVVAVYRAYERLAILRRETARALETFANVVDERDPTTYRHSARVAGYVESLARSLGLPSAQVARLRWAGRLHDLGKIAVDTSVLLKPTRLSPEEQAIMRTHARLSARLLRRFRFATAQARAVEYHHERYDGGGYYQIEREQLPVAAHFLIIADSFDAMTSDRPYRDALSLEDALAELERGAGSQFHPALVRAFVAQQRGQDPATVLSDAERQELRRGDQRPGGGVSHWDPETPVTVQVAVGSCAAALVALGVGIPMLSLPAIAAAAAALAWRRRSLSRALRLARVLRDAADAETPAEVFDEVARRLAEATPVAWVGLVRLHAEESPGTLVLERSRGAVTPPRPDSISSWLLRDAEADELLIADGAEVGLPGTLAALRLGASDDPEQAWLAVALYRPSRRVAAALLDARPVLADALTPAPIRLAAVPAVAAAS